MSQAVTQSTNSPLPIQIAYRFKTSFTHQVLFARLSANPDMATDVLLAAATLNAPIRFLPQPWPPEKGRQPANIERNALLKMKYIVGRASDLASLNTAIDMQTLIFNRSLAIQRLDHHDFPTINAEVLLRADGEVNYSIVFPEQSLGSPVISGPQSGDGKDYVNDMILLSLQKEYEQRGT